MVGTFDALIGVWDMRITVGYFSLTMSHKAGALHDKTGCQKIIRKTKTDKVDTFPIAKTLVMQDSYRFVSL